MEDPFAHLSSDVELAQEKQDEIWLAEHVTFELEQRFGKKFTGAWKRQAADDLSGMALPNFHSHLLPLNATEIVHGGLTQQTATEAPEEKTVDAAAWAEALVDEAERFDKIAGTTFRVLQIHREPERPQEWITRILLEAKGTEPEGKRAELSTEHDVTFVVPEDATEVENIPVIKSWTVATWKFREAPKAMFREVTHDVGLDEVGLEDNWDLPKEEVQQYRFQFAVADYDQDGWLDLAVAEQTRSRLFHWDPSAGRFVNVTQESGINLVHMLMGVAVDLAGWIDYDNDGYPDLLLGNRLYHNEQGRKFVDVTADSGLNVQAQGTGVHVADFDGDGLLDLYILYQASRQTELPESKLRWVEEVSFGEQNRLWKNMGNGKFQDVTRAAHAGGGVRHTLAGTVFHYDDDPYPDIYAANDLSTNVLLRNKGDGTFEDLSDETGTSDFATSMGVAAGDTDNNGVSDLYVANMYSKMGRRIIGQVTAEDYPEGIYQQIQGSCAGNRLYRRSAEQQKYDEFGESFNIHGVGWAYAPALADFDNDGWLDIYSTTGFLSFERGEPDG